VQILGEHVPGPSPLCTPDKQDPRKLQDQVAALIQQVQRLQGHPDVFCSPPRDKQFSRLQQELDTAAVQKRLPFSRAKTTRVLRDAAELSEDDIREGWSLNLGKRLRRTTVHGRERVDCKFRVTRQRITICVFRCRSRDEDDAGMDVGSDCEA
jgi:hypothetical protein